jgi:hypothetical protein
MVFLRLNKGMRLVSSFLIIISFVFFVFSFAACGRRGDPVPISPYENIVQEDADVEKDQDRIPVEEEVSRESGALMPDAPVGLMALYTQTAVVLIWDDVKGQEVKRYNIYRSSGDGYVFVGDTAAAAFTDRKVKPDTKYYYKVTSVGILESQPSKEIVIVTEVH